MSWRSTISGPGLLAIALPVVATGPGPIGPAVGVVQVSEFDVALFRTRRAAEFTLVDGLVEFDPRIVEGGAACSYEIDIQVRDSAGLSIYEDEWERELECGEDREPGERSVRVVDTFQFAVKPGRYSVELILARSGGDEAVRTGVYDFESLPLAVPASDLILGREVGVIDSTNAESWTVSKGQVGIAADPYVVADPMRPELAYYVEAYPQGEVAIEGEVIGVVRRPEGTEIVRGTLGTLPAGEFAVPVTGTLSLAGLPPGDYALEVQVPIGDTIVRRSRGFRMVSSFAMAPTARSAIADSLREYFTGLTDPELERLFDPIEVWIDSERERRRYRSFSAAQKRRYLIQFFLNMASSTAAVGDSPLELYLERVRHVGQRFGEAAGREGHAGWRTDRGRIYLMRGDPEERLDRPFERGSDSPYEIWAYAGGRGYVYLFVDETGFGNYRLVFSNDPREPPLPGWQTKVGRGAVQELDRYLGTRGQMP